MNHHHTFDTAKQIIHREALPAIIAVIILASTVLFAAHAGAAAPQPESAVSAAPSAEPAAESIRWDPVTVAVPFETTRIAKRFSTTIKSLSFATERPIV